MLNPAIVPVSQTILQIVDHSHPLLILDSSLMQILAKDLTVKEVSQIKSQYTALQ